MRGERFCHAGEFAVVLRAIMRRSSYTVTPGWLSKMTGIPKATIVNWLEGRVGRPRSPQALAAVCQALRLAPDEVRLLYDAAGEISIDAPTVLRPFDEVPVGLYTTSLDGRILSANAVLVRMMGYATDEEYRTLDVGRDLYVDAHARTEWVSRILQVGTVRRERVLARRRDGTTIWMHDSARVVRDVFGDLQFHGAWEPIDEQK